MISTLGKWTVALVLCLCLTACGTRITKENYEKIKTGMTEAEVHNILGNPTDSFSMNAGGFGGMNINMDMKTEGWRHGNTMIWINFSGGKVLAKMGFFEGNDSSIDFSKPPLPNGMPNPGDKPNPWPFGNQPQGVNPNPGQIPNPGQNPNPNPNPNPGGGGVKQPEGGGKVTKANFDKIQNGMTEQQVTELLGPASESFPLGDSRVLQWKDGNNVPLITIHTRNNKVVLKAAGFGLK
jgi:hypothetical protein